METVTSKHLTMDMVYWITERYAMKMRKETPGFVLLKHGYSHDPNMGTVRYCNVHREDDKVTKWIRTFWNRGSDPAWKFVLGRMINLPETLEHIRRRAIEHQFSVDPLSEAKQEMKSLRDEGNKVWTSAYTISTCGRQMDKIDYVFDHVVAGVKRKEESGSRPWVDCSKTCEDSWRTLQEVDGLGSFLAAQVVADMKNTKGHPLEKADDWWTFSAPGPGSLRGLDWYFNSDHMMTGARTGIITSRWYEVSLTHCRDEVDHLLPDYVPRISNQDFQNCLCEFSKYCKVKYLNGHVRNRYVAHHQS